MATLKFLNADSQWEVVDMVGAVKYTEPQTLSAEQQAQVRENLGLSNSDSGRITWQEF
jgi:Flp pilus assembly protein TadD